MSTKWPLAAMRAQDVILKGVQRAVASVASGLRGVESGSDISLIPGPQIHIQVGGAPPPSIEDLRAKVLADGFQTCADSIGVALLWVYREAALWSQPGTVVQREDGSFRLSAVITGESWNDEIVAGAQRFETMNLPTKVERLERLGIDLPELTPEIRSLNAARNCLVHRGGLVSPKDADSSGSMTVFWRRIQLTAEEDGSSSQVFIGSQLGAGTVLRVSFEQISRTYALGDRILLSADDFAQMAQVYMIFAQQLGESILGFQRRRFEHQNAERLAAPEPHGRGDR